MAVVPESRTTGLRVEVRPFGEDDYPRLIEIVNQSFPDYVWSVEEARHEDAIWDHSRYVKQRVVAVVEGRVVGTGVVNHIPDEFHPHKYWLQAAVDPAVRRRGIGGALYARLIEILAARDALAARASVPRETDTETLGFLTRRGFMEVQRGWRSVLDVAAFDFSAFATAGNRVAAQGISLTTLAKERARDGEALQKAYALTMACEQDVPSADPVTETSFDHFLAHAVESPNAVPDAFFIATDGGRYIGMSGMYRPLAEPGVLYQGLTGVLREYRGRGIAMALKLRTVRYALEHGYREIRTWNDARNRPMLRINEAMGFAKQPATIVLERRL